MPVGDPALPPYAIESIDNALRLLLMFRDRQKVRVVDVSEELHVARSTAHRMLATLEHRGFVSQERGSRSYYLGKAFLEIGMLGMGEHNIRGIALKIMQRLTAEIHENLSLLVLEGGESRFVVSVDADRSPSAPSQVGMLLPAYATSGGKVLLAELGSQEIEELFSGGLGSLTSNTVSSRTDLLGELQIVRERGFATNRGETLDGLNAVAVPVRNPRGKAVAALAASVPRTRGSQTRLEQLAMLLKAAAEEIGQML